MNNTFIFLESKEWDMVYGRHYFWLYSFFRKNNNSAKESDFYAQSCLVNISLKNPKLLVKSNPETLALYLNKFLNVGPLISSHFKNELTKRNLSNISLSLN